MLVSVFDKLAFFWESKKANRLFSNILIITFILLLSLAVLKMIGILDNSKIVNYINFYSCINISFSILLIIEMVSLVFVIPESIANSIGKQFEILCLILLRSAFKEFSKIDLIHQVDFSIETIIKMVAEGSSALFLFLFLGYYYKLQKHKPIALDLIDNKKFINIKKIIALFIILAMILIGCLDFINFLKVGIFKQSLNNFYVLLILADLLFMLIAFRYVIHFPNVFRYSAFVLITILIRLSLAAPIYWNGILAIFASLYAIGVVSFYNFFISGRNKYIETKN